MAINDIFHVQVNYEAPTGHASFGLYYQQTVDSTLLSNDNEVLGDAWIIHFGDVWREILSVEWWFVGIKVQKKDGLPAAAYLKDNQIQNGTFLSPALPANNTILFGIKQNTLGAKHDGRIFAPGVPESETKTGTLNQSFFDPNVEAVRLLLDTEIAEESGGDGRWTLGVINQAILNVPVPPAPKDWAGAFALKSSISATTIIATQRRRQTKVGHRVLA